MQAWQWTTALLLYLWFGATWHLAIVDWFHLADRGGCWAVCFVAPFYRGWAAQTSSCLARIVLQGAPFIPRCVFVPFIDGRMAMRQPVFEIVLVSLQVWCPRGFAGGDAIVNDDEMHCSMPFVTCVKIKRLLAMRLLCHMQAFFEDFRAVKVGSLSLKACTLNFKWRVCQQDLIWWNVDVCLCLVDSRNPAVITLSAKKLWRLKHESQLSFLILLTWPQIEKGSDHRLKKTVPWCRPCHLLRKRSWRSLRRILWTEWIQTDWRMCGRCAQSSFGFVACGVRPCLLQTWQWLWPKARSCLSWV